MDFSNFQISSLITPAILLSSVVYLANFFGKIITDQQPFADERKWHVQLSGSMFVLNLIPVGVFAVYLAKKYPIGIGYWWLHLLTFISLAFFGTGLFLFNRIESNRIFNYQKKIFEAFDERYYGFPSWYGMVGKYFIIPLPFVLFYFYSLEVSSGNQFWIILFSAQGLLLLFWLAFAYSLSNIKDIAPVNIYLLGSESMVLKDVIILKYNEDNIRCRQDNTILFINKNEVLKIEMKIPEEKL